MSEVEVKVGDRVMIYPAGWGRATEPVEAEVTSAARVWLTIEATLNPNQKWRMRRDTQDEGDRQYPQGNARFLTLAQYAAKQRAVAAHTFLRTQGIQLAHDSVWRGREVELATRLLSIGLEP